MEYNQPKPEKHKYKYEVVVEDAPIPGDCIFLTDSIILEYNNRYGMTIHSKRPLTPLETFRSARNIIIYPNNPDL
jgi:hypothetical protein